MVGTFGKEGAAFGGIGASTATDAINEPFYIPDPNTTGTTPISSGFSYAPEIPPHAYRHVANGVDPIGNYAQTFSQLQTFNAGIAVNNITVSGNSILGTVTSGTWNGSPIAISKGGTGATDAASARSNLGLAIGIDVQAYSANVYLTGNQTITLSGDVVGTGATGISTTLATLSPAVGGTFTNANITVDGKGRVTAASNGLSAPSMVGTSPVSAVTAGGTTTISMSAAGSTTSGYLSSADWSLFSGKQAALSAANATTNGYLSSADWILFNSKQAPLPAASASLTGYLTNYDWITFNSKVTNVSGTAPVSVSNVSGIVTVGMSAAGSTTSGYLSSADWNVFNGLTSQVAGTVSKVYAYNVFVGA